MRNNGFTLTEVIIVIVISTIAVMAIGFNLVAANYFRAAAQDNIELSREARVAVNHITRTFRFAKPASISAGSNQISATIEAGHLPFITSDTPVAYTRDIANNTLEYTQGGVPNAIAGGGNRDIDITYFDGLWNGTELLVQVTATKEGRSVSIQTRILVLGG